MSAKVIRWTRYLGDSDQIQVQLSGVSEILPGATVAAKVVDTNDATTNITGASVSDLADKIVNVPLTAWLGDNGTAAGRYRLYIVLNDVTWPEEGAAEIDVKPNYAPVP